MSLQNERRAKNRREFFALGCLAAGSLCLPSCHAAAARTVVLDVFLWLVEDITEAALVTAMSSGELEFKALVQDSDGGKKRMEKQKLSLSGKKCQLISEGAKLLLRTLSKLDIEVPNLLIRKGALVDIPINISPHRDESGGRYHAGFDSGVCRRRAILDPATNRPDRSYLVEFIKSFYLAGASNSPMGQYELFAEQVAHFGSLLSKSEVARKLAVYNSRWSYRRYFIQSVSLRRIREDRTAEAFVDFAYICKRGQKTKPQMGRHHGVIKVSWDHLGFPEVTHLSIRQRLNLSANERKALERKALNDC